MSHPPLPEPWRAVLERRGISSRRALANKAGISPQTASRLVNGEGRPDVNTVAAVADALFEGDRGQVWSLVGADLQDHGDWQLPAEASLLDPEQRAAVLAVVWAMLPAEARHLTPETAESKQERRRRTEPTVAEWRAAQLRAVAQEGADEDAGEVDDLARRARERQTEE